MYWSLPVLACGLGTHLERRGVSWSYSTWCFSGIRGRMASNSGRRLGSLMTSFRSPTSTVTSMVLWRCQKVGEGLMHHPGCDHPLPSWALTELIDTH